MWHQFDARPMLVSVGQQWPSISTMRHVYWIQNDHMNLRNQSNVTKSQHTPLHTDCLAHSHNTHSSKTAYPTTWRDREMKTGIIHTGDPVSKWASSTRGNREKFCHSHLWYIGLMMILCPNSTNSDRNRKGSGTGARPNAHLHTRPQQCWNRHWNQLKLNSVLKRGH